MYLPKLHEERDLATLHALVRAHPLGTWATQAAEGILMNHIPFLLHPTRGEFGTLECHVARANPVWKSFSTRTESVIAFQGPETYISPSWYASKALHGKVVPTWNYAVVHVHGIPTLLEESRLLQQLEQLTLEHESDRPLPWKVTDAPAEFIRHMSQQIVGIEIPVTRIIGKWKVSQNRSADDRRGVVAGLEQNADEASAAMAQLIVQAVRED